MNLVRSKYLKAESLEIATRNHVLGPVLAPRYNWILINDVEAFPSRAVLRDFRGKMPRVDNDVGDSTKNGRTPIENAAAIVGCCTVALALCQPVYSATRRCIALLMRMYLIVCK